MQALSPSPKGLNALGGRLSYPPFNILSGLKTSASSPQTLGSWWNGFRLQISWALLSTLYFPARVVSCFARLTIRPIGPIYRSASYMLALIYLSLGRCSSSSAESPTTSSTSFCAAISLSGLRRKWWNRKANVPLVVSCPATFKLLVFHLPIVTFWTTYQKCHHVVPDRLVRHLLSSHGIGRIQHSIQEIIHFRIGVCLPLGHEFVTKLMHCCHIFPVMSS